MTYLVGFLPENVTRPSLVAIYLVKPEITFLSCHVTQEDHVIEESSKFMSANHSRKSPYS